jgi:hypothetical protein
VNIAGNAKLFHESESMLLNESEFVENNMCIKKVIGNKMSKYFIDLNIFLNDLKINLEVITIMAKILT